MANWKNKVDISDLHENEQLEVHELSHAVANRLKAIKPLKFATEYQKEIFDDLIDQFESLDESSDVDDYDNILADLYNLGDYKHLLWINTFVCLKNRE